MKVYLAGPMRGREDDNRPEFLRAARDLRSAGYAVLSPAEKSIESGVPAGLTNGRDFIEEMLWDLRAVTQVDAVVLLDGWEHSEGVSLELAMARFVRCRVMTLMEALNRVAA